MEKYMNKYNGSEYNKIILHNIYICKVYTKEKPESGYLDILCKILTKLRLVSPSGPILEAM